jgi:hypothetical protein
MHYHGGRGYFFLELMFGIALIWNCARGLARREDMYDKQSTLYTTAALWLGIVIGGLLLLHVSWMLRMIFNFE